MFSRNESAGEIVCKKLFHGKSYTLGGRAGKYFSMPPTIENCCQNAYRISNN